MKTIAISLAFYLFIAGLFPFSDLNQLNRLSVFFEHFEEHQLEANQLGTTISLVEFVKIHFFISGDHEHDEHQNLPLKSITSGLVFNLPQNVPFVATPAIDLYNQAFSFYSNTYHSDLIRFLFRPPII